MAGFEDVVKKAFYLGVGFASYAQEKAGDAIKDFPDQAQKLADEMIKRGEMTTDEARKFVDDMVEQAQQNVVTPGQKPNDEGAKAPRRIEIISDDESSEETVSDDENIDDLRKQVQSLQEELRNLKK